MKDNSLQINSPWILILKILALLILIIGSVVLNACILTNQINISDGSLITIDSLITSSSVAFVAFVNYSANASGSSQMSRKLNWSNFNLSKSSSSTLKFLYCFFFPFTNNMGFLLSLSILFTIGIPFSSFNDYCFKVYVFTSIIISGLILLGILYRFILFNSEPYLYSADVFFQRAMKLISKGNKEKIVSFGRTYLNIIRGTSNITLLNEMAKKFHTVKDASKWNILVEKFRLILSEGEIKEKDRVKIFYTFQYYSSTKNNLKIKDIENNFLSLLGISREDYLKKNAIDATYIIKVIMDEHFKFIKHN